MNTTFILQAFAFTSISLSFIVCVIAVVWPMIREALRDIFRKPIRHEAVILQFRPQSRGGRFNVR